MRSELFIENKRLDVSSDFSSLLTFAIDDIKDFSSRNTNFSKTIILPGTANNNMLLGNIFDFSVSNFYLSSADNVGSNYNASKGAECVMFQNNVQVFKGVLRLMEIVITNRVPEYEVAVFGELGGLVSAIGASKLEDLDFSAYDHVWNETNIVNSWNASGTGYYYPLIDYGGVSTDKLNFDIKAFRPALFVSEYISKIFTAAGYTYSSALMDSARFKKLIVPNNLKDFKRATYRVISASRTSTANVLDTGTGSPLTIPWNTTTLYLFSVSSNLFTYTGTDPLNLKVIINMTAQYIANSTGYKLTLFKNGVEVPAFTKNIARAFDTTTRFTNWTVTDDIGLVTGDTIRLRAEETLTMTGTDSIKLLGTMFVDSYTPISVDITYGNTIPINETIPRNVLQKDFLSSILKLFNLYVTEDVNKRKFLNIEPYVDFYDLDPTGFIDWTYKLDRSKEIRLKLLSELNSRYYNFNFKRDSDYYNDLYYQRYGETYGNFVYNSDYEFVNEKTDIDIIFSPTVLLGYSGNDKVIPTIFKKSSGIEERMDTNIRILQTKKITGVATWSIKNGATVLTSATDYGYAGHYDDPDVPANDIHFGVPRELFFTLVSGSISNTQFNAYWSSYMAEITDKDSKLMTAWFKLTTTDIFNLDFSKLLFIDGAYWRLNRIIDWNASTPDLCKIELLKVIYLIY